MVSDAASHSNAPLESRPRVLISGGSGFIGTNVVQKYIDLGYDVRNIDIVGPRNADHTSFFTHCDLLDRESVEKIIREYNPHYVFHLAARADLEGVSVEDYNANTDGVDNILSALQQVRDLRGVIFASSMLVCKHGILPKHENEYCPDTPYGESKVIGEGLVRRSGLGVPWCIIRPTSIWGPWFSVPYISFFRAVRRGIYVHPRGLKIRRSYGYVENVVNELVEIMGGLASGEMMGRTYYLADREPIDVKTWADQISKAFGRRPVVSMPLPLLKTMAYTGDMLRLIGWRDPPLSSRRLRNLTTSSVIAHDWFAPVETVPPVAMSEAVVKTVTWMKNRGQ